MKLGGKKPRKEPVDLSKVKIIINLLGGEKIERNITEVFMLYARGTLGAFGMSKELYNQIRPSGVISYLHGQVFFMSEIRYSVARAVETRGCFVFLDESEPNTIRIVPARALKDVKLAINK